MSVSITLQKAQKIEMFFQYLKTIIQFSKDIAQATDE